MRLDVVGRPPSNCWAGRVREVDVLHSKNTRAPRGMPAETEPMRACRPRHEKSQLEGTKQCWHAGNGQTRKVASMASTPWRTCRDWRCAMVCSRSLIVPARTRNRQRDMQSKLITRRASCPDSCPLLHPAVSNPGRMEQSVLSCPPLPRFFRTLASLPRA